MTRPPTPRPAHAASASLEAAASDSESDDPASGWEAPTAAATIAATAAPHPGPGRGARRGLRSATPANGPRTASPYRRVTVLRPPPQGRVSTASPFEHPTPQPRSTPNYWLLEVEFLSGLTSVLTMLFSRRERKHMKRPLYSTYGPGPDCLAKRERRNLSAIPFEGWVCCRAE